MIGKRIGYVRVSTISQNTERQLENIKLDRIFKDSVSGKDKKRPALTSLLEFVREGDKVYVHSLDRMARNLEDLRNIIKDLLSKGVQIEFVKEQLIFSGKDSSISMLLLSVLGAFAEFERSLLLERQREGIKLAKGRGVYKGRKRSLSDETVSILKEKCNQGRSKTALAKEFGISRETLYRYLRKMNLSVQPTVTF